MIERPGGFQIQRFCVRPGRHIMESAEPDDPEFGDAAHCRAALHKPVAIPGKEAAKNTVEVPQIVGAVKIAETPGAAQVAQEAAENAVEAPQRLPKVAARIIVEKCESRNSLDYIYLDWGN